MSISYVYLEVFDFGGVGGVGVWWCDMVWRCSGVVVWRCGVYGGVIWCGGMCFGGVVVWCDGVKVWLCGSVVV